MLDLVLLLAAAFLVLNVLISLVRVVRGPRPHDRMLALLLMGTTAVGVLALLAHLMQMPALRDAGLALVSLAVLVVAGRVGALKLANSRAAGQEASDDS